MVFKRLLPFFSALILAGAVSAEILHNMQPLDTLGDIRKKYPNATISRVKAAWVTEGQDFFQLKGVGFPGELMLAFSDNRPFFRKELETTQLAAQSGRPVSDALLDIQKSAANATDDNALKISWVRWAPYDPLPLERFKAKYGAPTKCDFLDTDMTPYCQWAARGLSVRLSDDRKDVLFVEAQFTVNEYVAACLARGYRADYCEYAYGKKDLPKGNKKQPPPHASSTNQ